MRVSYDTDADLDLIKSKRVAVIGYGSQGFGHSDLMEPRGLAEVSRAGVVAAARGSKGL